MWLSQYWIWFFLTSLKPFRSVGLAAVGEKSFMSWSSPLVARIGMWGCGSKQLTTPSWSPSMYWTIFSVSLSQRKTLPQSLPLVTYSLSRPKKLTPFTGMEYKCRFGTEQKRNGTGILSMDRIGHNLLHYFCVQSTCGYDLPQCCELCQRDRYPHHCNCRAAVCRCGSRPDTWCWHALVHSLESSGGIKEEGKDESTVVSPFQPS